MSNKIAHFLLLVFLVILVALKKIGTSDEITNGGIVITGLLCYLYMLLEGKKSVVSKISKYGVIMSIFFILSYVYNTNAHFVNILWIWAFLGVAALFYEKGLNKNYILAVFILYCLVSIYEVVYLGVTADELTNTGSANSVSAQSIFLLGLYYLAKRRDNNDSSIEYWPVFIIAIISVLTATRSSLVALGVFLVFAVIYNFRRPKHKVISIFVLLISIAFAIYLFINYYDTYGAAFEAKTEIYGMESARSEIWSDYITGMFDSVGNFLFGVPSDVRLYKYYFEFGGNTHNSFLMLHAKFGLGGFILFLYFIISATILSVRRKQFIILGVTLLFVIRSSFDWMAFPGYYDVFFWYLLLYNFEKTISSIDCQTNK